MQVHTSVASFHHGIGYPDRVKKSSARKPIETEIKLRVENAAKARSLLRRYGFKVVKPRVFEQNRVLDDAKGSMRGRGMLLRVRSAGERITCTFKGVENSGRHKSREEREFHADNLDECTAVFAALGFTEKFRYEKYRTEFARTDEPGNVTLDETPIGTLMELEGPPRWIDATAKELGFPRSSYVLDSYGRLYEKWCEENGLRKENMTFNPRRRRPRSSQH